MKLIYKRLFSSRHLLILGFITILSLLCSSCKKFVTIAPPITQITAVNVFSNDQTATSAVVGLYSQMMQTNLSFMNGAMSVYAGLAADEIYNTAPSATNYDPFTNNALVNTNNIVQTNFWKSGYSEIYQANACIE